jgi:2-isopropylmalate synthase
MGRHSGKHSFQEKLDQYHIRLNPEQLDQAFEKFSALADRKKEVYDEDIFDIASSILGRIPGGYQLLDFNCHTGITLMPTATVRVRRGDGGESVASATGDGPVDALFMAIENAIGRKTALKEYVIQAIGSGKDAQGHVKLILEIDGEDYMGRGSSTDIIEASAIAHINAVNRHHLRQSANAWLHQGLRESWPCEEVI